jgi:endonuclease YncB( thermonuclease family)
MARPSIIGCVVALLLLGSSGPARAADSLYGRVTTVRSATVVVLNYGKGEYVVRIVGIDPPESAALARQASQFLSNLVLGKMARIRLEQRGPNGEMIARLFTDAPQKENIKDVGLELLKAGLARHQATYDGKYGEMAAAEREAREARRGIWAAGRGREQ